MKVRFTTLLLTAMALLGSYTATAQIGTLDADWDTDGVRVDSFDTGNDVARVVRVQPDGKVIICGNADIQGDIDIALIRYNTDGTPDHTFSGDGKATFNFGTSYDDYGYNMALQPDGKILVCGLTDSNSLSHNGMIVLRLNADGSPDQTFGSQGIVVINPNSAYCYPSVIAYNTATHKIALAGDLWGTFFIYQMDSTGAPDATFGTGGMVKVAPATSFSYDVHGLAYQPDGRLVSAGTYGANGDIGMYANRFNTDGTPDASFSVDGLVTTKFGSNNVDRCAGMALQADGKIVLAGYDYDYGNNVSSYALVRYNTDGTLDLSFNGTGHSAISFSGYACQATGIAIAADGKYLLSGNASPTNLEHHIAVTRVNTDGTKDTYFGTGGQTLTNAANFAHQTCNDVAQAPDGRIVTTGEAGPDATAPNMATMRYLSGLHVGISDLHTQASAALIYPNPIQPTEILRYTLSSDEKVTIQLYSTDGKMLQEFITEQPRTTGENIETLSFSPTLSAGDYILRLSTSQGSCNIKVNK